MTDYHKESLTQEEFESQYQCNTVEELRNRELTFGPQETKAVMVVLPSLDGVVEIGLGATQEEARESYLSNIVDLIHELELKEMQIRLGGIELEYTEVKGV